MATTAWSATYNGVNGVVKEFTPSTIGINPLPSELLEQFNSLSRHAAAIISEKTAGHGPGQKYNVVLSGAGDTGHKGSNTLSISITQV